MTKCLKGSEKDPQIHPAETYEAGEAWINKKLKALKVEKFTSGQTFGADEALIKLILKELKSRKKEKPYIIVFCPITSRVGSDVESALENVKRRTHNGESQQTAARQDDERIILVLMHHTRDPDYSTAGRIWSETTNNVALDVHVLFHETVPGLLACSQNDKAVHQMVNILKKQKKKQKQNKLIKPDQRKKEERVSQT